jgi:hypothetical protein
MEAASLQERLDREPFVPFRLQLSNGQTVDIVDPSLVVIMRREVFVADPSRDHWHLYALRHIVGVDSAEAA